MSLGVRGFKGSIGIGTEATWGTEVARDRWMQVYEVDLEKRPRYKNLPRLGAIGDLSTNWRTPIQVAEDAGGRIVFPVAYQDASLSFLHQMLGATPVESGAGPFVHTFKIASPGPVGLTIEAIKGEKTAQNAAQEFYGCKVESWELSMEAGGELVASLDIVARTGGSLQAAPAAPTYGTPVFVQHNHLTTKLTGNAVTREITKLSLRGSRNFQKYQEIGSLQIAEPLESRFSLELDLEMMWQQNDWHSDFYAGTVQDYTLAFQGPGNNAFAFVFHNALVTEKADPTTGPEGVRQTVKLALHSDGGSGDQGLQIAVTNDNALFSAN